MVLRKYQRTDGRQKSLRIKIPLCVQTGAPLRGLCQRHLGRHETLRLLDEDVSYDSTHSAGS